MASTVLVLAASSTEDVLTQLAIEMIVARVVEIALTMNYECYLAMGDKKRKIRSSTVRMRIHF